MDHATRFSPTRSRMLRPLFVALVALVSALGAQTASADPVAQINELSISQSITPSGIAPGPDGNIWFADTQTVAIGRITPQGQVSEFTAGLNTGSFPIRISLGPDGNMWFTDEGTTRAIGRITPQGQITEFSAGLNPGSLPVRIAAGADGNLWFTDTGSTNAIGRITPQGQITEFPTPSSDYPVAIAQGADGNMWFTDQPNGSPAAIGRITSQGQITLFGTGLSVGSNPYAIAPGPDGNLWFTDFGTPAAIGRITPQGTITEFSNGLNSGAMPGAGIAPGPDGNLWFTDNGTTPAIGRVTPQGQISEYSTGLNSGSSPEVIAPGADGNLWFADRGTTYAIGKVGTGEPAAVLGAPIVSGSGRAGSPLSCNPQWSTWVGLTPSASLYGFDGYQWMRDGVPIAGQTGQSYTPALGDVGHELSCQVTATYPLPFFVTAPSAASAVTIVDPAIPTLQSLRLSPSRFSLTGRKVRGHCVDVTRANRDGRHCRRSIALRVSYSVSAPATVTFTIEQRGSGRLVGGRCVRATHANRRKGRCSRIMLGSFSLAANAGTDAFTFGGRFSGHLLGAGSYWLTVTPADQFGQAGNTQSVTFKILG